MQDICRKMYSFLHQCEIPWLGQGTSSWQMLSSILRRNEVNKKAILIAGASGGTGKGIRQAST
jgi:hypothetical protein